MDEKKFTVIELVEAISGLSNLDKLVVGDILKGEVIADTLRDINLFAIAESRYPTLIKAIATWNLEFPAHKDDCILLLLEELLEDVLCQKQLGKEGKEGVDHL